MCVCCLPTLSLTDLSLFEAYTCLSCRLTLFSNGRTAQLFCDVPMNLRTSDSLQTQLNIVFYVAHLYPCIHLRRSGNCFCLHLKYVCVCVCARACVGVRVCVSARAVRARLCVYQLRASYTSLGQLLCCAHKRIVNIMKVYIERYNMHVELIRLYYKHHFPRSIVKAVHYVQLIPIDQSASAIHPIP